MYNYFVSPHFLSPRSFYCQTSIWFSGKGGTSAKIEGITLTVKTLYPFIIGLRQLIEGVLNIVAIRFGAHLEKEERAWLVQEINTYLEKWNNQRIG
jgi:hypothetical protein